MNSNSLETRIGRALKSDIPFTSIKSPIGELLKQAGKALAEKEKELRTAKEELVAARRALLKMVLNQSNHNNPHYHTTGKWE